MASGLELVPITSQKHDPAWKHCEMYKNGDRVQLKCIYCNKVFKGGGIHRIKEHLAGQKGNASTCFRVPQEVKDLMLESLNGAAVKKRKRQKLDGEITNIDEINGDVKPLSIQSDVNSGPHLIAAANMIEPSSGLTVIHEEGTVCNKSVNKKKRRGKSSSNETVVVPNGTVGCSKRVNSHVHMAIGRFLYDIGATFDSVNSAYFQPMIETIISEGPGVVMPSYHDLRSWVLKNSVEEIKNDVEKCRSTWERNGCSILVYQRITKTGKLLLSFLVYSCEGTVFLKSVDVSEIINSPDNLYELFKEVVEEVGVKNVVQVITSGEDHYIVAGRRLTDTYPTFYFTPCAARCIDLILVDFGSIPWIQTVIEQARSITRFVYNNSAVLNMVRRFTGGKDILEPGITRFATNFSTLKRMADLKYNLQSLVTAQEWMDCPYSKAPVGLEMLDTVSNPSFWSSCSLVARLTSPILRVLRIMGSKKRPAMGYVYAGMYRAKETIKREFIKREDYMMYWEIIDRRWEQQWNLPLHAAGFYLNPKFFYSIETIPGEILSGMFDSIERLVSDTKVQDKIIKEINVYKNAVGDFGRKMAIRSRDSLLPAEWWSTYGGGCLNLASLAIRILNQTSSLIGCKQNQIAFEKIHETKNHLEHRRLNDLVFVQNNLRLKQMADKTNGQDMIDPISYNCLNTIEDWVNPKNSCLEECENSDWTSLDPPAVTVPLGPPNDDDEDLGAGFGDFEIFFRKAMEEEEENILENVE